MYCEVLEMKYWADYQWCFPRPPRLLQRSSIYVSVHWENTTKHHKMVLLCTYHHCSRNIELFVLKSKLQHTVGDWISVLEPVGFTRKNMFELYAQLLLFGSVDSVWSIMVRHRIIFLVISWSAPIPLYSAQLLILFTGCNYKYYYSSRK